MLAMVLRGKRVLLTQSKEQEDEIAALYSTDSRGTSRVTHSRRSAATRQICPFLSRRVFLSVACLVHGKRRSWWCLLFPANFLSRIGVRFVVLNLIVIRCCQMRRRGHSMIITVKLGFKSAVGGSAGAYTSNPFDLFETFFGASMGDFSGMDQGTFRRRRKSAAVQGEDIRFVARDLEVI
ncbi:hypothetical protein ABZP36_000906 [Zizania latifolia]